MGGRAFTGAGVHLCVVVGTSVHLCVVVGAGVHLCVVMEAGGRVFTGPNKCTWVKGSILTLSSTSVVLPSASRAGGY